MVAVGQEILDTHFIVGRDFGSVCRQANAIVAMRISWTTTGSGGGRRWSNTSHSIIFWEDEENNKATALLDASQ